MKRGQRTHEDRTTGAGMTLRIEHVVGPVDRREQLREHVRSRVEETIAADGRVCVIDFASSLGPFVQEWSGYDDAERFVLFLPESFEDAESVIKTMCKAGVDLLVLHSPRLGEMLRRDPCDEEPLPSRWRPLLGALRTLEVPTVVLAANVYRGARFPGFEPWSDMATKETVLAR